MAAKALTTQKAEEFLAFHPDADIYAPDGTIYRPVDVESWLAITCLSTTTFVAFQAGLRSLDEVGIDASSLAGTNVDDDIFARLLHEGLIASETITKDELASRLVRQGVIAMDPDAFEHGSLDVLDSVEDVKALMGRDALDQLVSATLAKNGVEIEAQTYKADYYDREAPDNLIGSEAIDGWLCKRPVNDFMDEAHVEHTYEGFVAYMQELFSERSYDDYQRAEVDVRLTDAVVDAIVDRLRSDELLPAHIDIDKESLWAPVREQLVMDRYVYDYNIEYLIDHHSEVCVDVILTDGMEWNSDFANISLLQDALNDPDDLWPGAKEDALANNGMSWLAEQMGLPRDVMLTAADKDSPGHDFYYELENVMGGSRPVMTVFARLSLDDWIRCIEAKAQDKDIALAGNTFYAGLFDPWSGAGSTLDMAVDKPLVIPAKNIRDLSLEFRHGDKLVGDIFGWTAMNVYGTDETLFRSGYAILAPETIHDLKGGKSLQDALANARQRSSSRR